jgi:pseudouridine-5'-phosphate glycosidase
LIDILFTTEVRDAISAKMPVVALESTVIAHGLPYPQNLETAHSLETLIRGSGAVPATIAVFDGSFCVGMSEQQLEHLATVPNVRKISRRDLPIAVARKLNCATTVATTAFIAHVAGIKVFSTGGIGGIHRGMANDISADLPELSQTPITVVCSGPKIVLDLEATREWLETNGITILGWKCDDMPAFYSAESGLPVDQRIETAEEAAAVIAARDEMALRSSILVTVPVPKENEVRREEVEPILANALELAAQGGITGKEITPFLLSTISEQSDGRTLTANIALLKSNARIAAEIAVAVSNYQTTARS